MTEIVQDIKENLEKIKIVIEKSNKQGLLDVAHHFEYIIMEILNILYDWELVNLNRDKPNYPYIDLYDGSRNIAVQVTTTNSNKVSKKIQNTIQRIDIEKVYFFSLFGYDSRSYSLWPNDFLLDTNSLIIALQQASDIKVKMVYETLMHAFDLVYFNPVDDIYAEMNKEFKIISLLNFTGFTHGKGRVRISAYIPKYFGEEFSCLVCFAKSTLQDSFIIINEKIAQEVLFKGHNGDLFHRGFVVYVDKVNDKAILQLGNVRFFTDYHTAVQLSELCDELYMLYLNQMDTVVKMIGAKEYDFQAFSKPMIAISDNIDEKLWIDMLKFANNHNACKSSSEWDIFNPCFNITVNSVITIFSDDRSSIACMLKRDASGIIYWMPGYTHATEIEEAYANGILWKVSKTDIWFNNIFISQVKFHKHNNTNLFKRIKLFLS